MKTNLKGVIPPVLTPLDEDGNIDYESLEVIINRMIDAGVDGLFMLGSTAGSAFMTNAQRIENVREIVRINHGRVPLLLGELNMNALRCIEQIDVTLSALGGTDNIDGIVCASPFYSLGNDDNIKRHYQDIHAAFPDLPLFAYDIPACTHQKLSPTLLMELAEEGALAGVKDSSGDDISFRLLMIKNEEAGHPLQIFTGHEVVVDGALLGGADGVVPGLANLFPEIYVEMYKASQIGDWARVKELQDKAARLQLVAMSAKNVAGSSAGVGGFKTALKLMGVIKTNKMFEPAITITGEDEQIIAEILKREGIL